MTRLKKSAVAFGVALALAQLVPVERSQPAPGEEPVLPSDVKAVLERSCYDCHSNRTRWPWYSNLAPVSWMVARHVAEGREHLNFTEWEKLRPKQRKNAWEDVGEAVRVGVMPLTSYVLGHPSAALSEADRALLLQWTSSAASAEGAEPSKP